MSGFDNRPKIDILTVDGTETCIRLGCSFCARPAHGLRFRIAGVYERKNAATLDGVTICIRHRTEHTV